MPLDYKEWERIKAGQDYQQMSESDRFTVKRNWAKLRLQNDDDFKGLPGTDQDEVLNRAAQFGGDISIPSPDVAPERGLAGDIGSSLARGGANLVEGVAGALRMADFNPETDEGFLGKVGVNLSEHVKKWRQRSEILKPDVSEASGNQGYVKESLMGAGESIPMSIAPMVGAGIGAAIGGALTGGAGAIPGAKIGGWLGGGLTMFSIFGGGTLQKTFDESKANLISKGVPEPEAIEKAKTHASVSAAAEVAFESIENVTGLKYFKLLGGKAVSQPLKATIKSLLGDTGKEFLKATSKTAATNVATEMATAGVQAESAKSAGVDTLPTGEAIAKSAGPAVVMSILFGSGAHGVNVLKAKQVYSDLNNEDAARRQTAVDFIASRLDEDSSAKWKEAAGSYIANGQKIEISKPIVDFAILKIDQDIQNGEETPVSEEVKKEPTYQQLNQVKIESTDLETGRVSPNIRNQAIIDEQMPSDIETIDQAPTIQAKAEVAQAQVDEATKPQMFVGPSQVALRPSSGKVPGAEVNLSKLGQEIARRRLGGELPSERTQPVITPTGKKRLIDLKSGDQANVTPRSGAVNSNALLQTEIERARRQREAESVPVDIYAGSPTDKKVANPIAPNGFDRVVAPGGKVRLVPREPMQAEPVAISQQPVNPNAFLQAEALKKGQPATVKDSLQVAPAQSPVTLPSHKIAEQSQPVESELTPNIRQGANTAQVKATAETLPTATDKENLSVQPTVAKPATVEKQPWDNRQSQKKAIKIVSQNGYESQDAYLNRLKKEKKLSDDINLKESYEYITKNELEKSINLHSLELAADSAIEHDYIPIRENNRFQEILDEHRADVEQALSSGKPVPENVLNDYPDLKEKYVKTVQAQAAPAEEAASDVEINRWENIINKQGDKGRERLKGYLASRLLSRKFNESGDDFLNRTGLNNFFEWAKQQTKGITNEKETRPETKSQREAEGQTKGEEKEVAAEQPAEPSRGKPVDKTFEQKMLKGDLEQAFDILHSEAMHSESGGVAYNEQGEAKGFSASSPQWMRNLQERMVELEKRVNKARPKGTPKKKLIFTRKEISTIYSHVKNGVPLTDKQYDRYKYLLDAAKEISETYEDFDDKSPQNKAAQIEKKGFDVYGGLEMAAGDINPGDRVIGEIDGVKDEYKHEGYDNEGNAIFKDGVTKKVDPFTQINVDGLKRKPEAKKPATEEQPLFKEPAPSLFDEPERAQSTKPKSKPKEKGRSALEQQNMFEPNQQDLFGGQEAKKGGERYSLGDSGYIVDLRLKAEKIRDEAYNIEIGLRSKYKTTEEYNNDKDYNRMQRLYDEAFKIEREIYLSEKNKYSENKIRGNRKKDFLKSIEQIMSLGEYSYYGLRANSPNPKTGRYKKIKIGDTTSPSYYQPDGNYTDSEHGTSAILIREIEDAEKQFDKIVSMYLIRGKEKIILIGSDVAKEGNDPGEVEMDNAKILSIYNDETDKYSTTINKEERENKETTSIIDDLNSTPAFKGRVSVDDNGKITMRLKDGREYEFKQVDDLEADETAARKGYGSEAEGLTVKGALIGNIVYRTKNGDKWTLLHEGQHIAEQAGLINDIEKGILNRAAKRAGISQELSPEEQRANFIEQALKERDSYRGTITGRILQKIGDFLDKIANLVHLTSRGIVRQFEAGEVFDREPGEANDQGPQYALLKSDQSDIDNEMSEYFGRSTKTFTEKVGSAFQSLRTVAGRDEALNEAIRLTVDRLNPIKTDLDLRSYKLARNINGFQQVFTAFLRHGKLDFKGDAPIVKTKGQGVMPFLESVGVDWKKFLYWVAAKRAVELEGQNRENWLDKTKRDDIFSKTAPENSARFGKANEEFKKFNDNILDFAEKAGLIDPEARAQWQQYYYVPFYRIFENEEEREAFLAAPRWTKKNIDAQIKRLKGANQKLGDPLENMLHNWMHLIHESMRNNARIAAFDSGIGKGVVTEVAYGPKAKLKLSLKEQARDIKKLRDKIKSSPSPELSAQLSAATSKYEQDTETHKKMEKDLASEYVTNKMRKADNVLSFRRNGEAVYFKVSDPALFAALADTKPQIMDNFIIKMMGSTKQLLTRGATFGPVFRINNMLRDTVHTAINQKDFKPFIDTWKGFKKTLLKDQDYIEFLSSGNSFGQDYLSSENPEKISKYIKEILDKEGKGGLKRILSTPKKMLEFWDEVGHASENAARLALYLNKKKAGLSHFDASFEARDVLDFSMKGASEAVQLITAITPFLNARMQGLYKLGRAYKENKTSFLIKGGMLTAASIALWAAFKDDERYKELKDYEKWAFYHFWIGDAHFRIPKPFEVGLIFSSAPETLLNVINGTENGNHITDFIGYSARNTLAADVPQLVKPIAEQWANKSFFTGSPIVGMGLENLPAGQQSDPYTSESLRWLGERLNISPKRAEALVRGYFSTIGLYGMGLADIFTRYAADFPERPSRTMDDYLGGMVKRSGPPQNTKYNDRFYEFFNEVDSIARGIKVYRMSGETAKAKELFDENRQELKFKPMATAVRGKLTTINKQMKIVMGLKIDSDEKRKRLDSLVESKNKLLKNFYKAMNQ